MIMKLSDILKAAELAKQEQQRTSKNYHPPRDYRDKKGQTYYHNQHYRMSKKPK